MTADAPVDGHAPRDHDEPGEHARLGPYRLVQRLGEGGMGVVHLGIDRHGRAVAVKVLRASIAHDPDARARLAREVDTLSRIRSPRVAPVVDADVDGDTPYVVTRFIDGPPLDRHVEARGPLPPDELHRLAAGLAEALDAIHSAGVVHRDVKPGNVLLVGDGDPVLIDFGIAHVADDVRLTSAGLVMGTPGYLAPEVVHGDDVTPATDWWGWAATTAFAASGTPPFGGGGMSAVLARVAAGEPDLVAVDPRIEGLLYAALSPYPDERPHQGEVVRGLERYARGELATSAVEVRRTRPETRAISTSGTAMLPATPSPAAPPAAGPSPAAAPAGPVPGARPDPPPPVGAGRPGPPPAALPPAPLPTGPPPAALPTGLDDDDEDVVRVAADPRIGRPTRTGSLLALLALLMGVTVAAPLAGLLVLATWMVLARTSDRAVTSLVMRRHERGARGSDVAVAVAAGPWHALVGVVGTLVTLALPLLVGVSAMFAGALVVGGATGQQTRADAVVPLAAAAAFTALTAWWGPGGASLRRGSRSLVRGLSGAPDRPPGAGRGRAPRRRGARRRHREPRRPDLVAADDGPRLGRPGGARAVSDPRTRRPRILRGDLPTEPMPMADLLRRTPYRHARIPVEAAAETTIERGLDLALRVGELMLRCGAGAPQVEGAIAATAAASGVDKVELDITLQSILLQARSDEGRRHTLLRVVRHTRFDYGRLVAVHRLVESLVAGEVTPDEATVRLRAIQTHRRNYPMWAISVANAVLASAVAVVIGASWRAAVLTVLVVLGVGGVARLHAKVDLPEFYGNAINAFAATLLTGGLYALGASGVIPFTGTDFAFVVAGGIVAMLPGRTMASAIEDVIFGYPLTGAGRLLAVLLSLTGLIIGIASGLGAMLTITEATGADFVSPGVLDLKVSQAPIVPALLASLVVGLAAGVTVQSRRRLVVPTGVLTLVGVAVGAVLTRSLGVGVVTATGIAAVSIGVLGRLLAQRMDAPSLVIVVPASFGLLPGLTIFRGLYELVAQGQDSGLLTFQSGLSTLLSAGGVLLAIATGTVLGEYLAAPWDRHVRGSRRPRTDQVPR